MFKIIKGDICYPKSEAMIIPSNTNGTMMTNKLKNISKIGSSRFIKDVKNFIENNNMQPGDCFSTHPGRFRRRGVKRIYHAVIKRFAGDFTSIFFVKNSINKAFDMAVKDGFKSVSICGIGIENGEIDKKTVAFIIVDLIKKYNSFIDVKIIDDDDYFIDELKKINIL